MAAQVISFNCVLKNRFGQVISCTTNRDVLATTGQHGQLKALAEALEKLQPGEKRTIVINAKEAYGFYNPKLSLIRNRFDLLGGESLNVGDVVNYVNDGNHALYRVVETNSQTVTLDGNHPLAGQDLVFEIEGMESRVATPEEVYEAINETSVYLH